MTNEISAEVVDRMAALVRDAVAISRDGKNIFKGVSRERTEAFLGEAIAIDALLPKPVDPDLIEARKIAKSYGIIEIENGLTDERTVIGCGYADRNPSIGAVLRAIKRGRELAGRSS